MPTTTILKGLEQGRAKFAYDCAEQAAKSPGYCKEYKSYVRKIPMMIKTNGLGSALAFVKAKTKAKSKVAAAYRVIYEHTTDWLKQAPIQLLDFSNNHDLVAEIIKLDSTQYRAVTVEVLAFFTWLRRFAEGLIEGEADEL